MKKKQPVNIVGQYDEIMAGTRKRFGWGTWTSVSDPYLRESLITIMNKRGYDLDRMKRELDVNRIKELKLYGIFNTRFNGSIYKFIDFMYPNQVEPWELKNTVKNSYTMERNVLGAKKWIADKSKLAHMLIAFINTILTFVKESLQKTIFYQAVTKISDFISYIFMKCERLKRSMAWARNRFVWG